MKVRTFILIVAVVFRMMVCTSGQSGSIPSVAAQPDTSMAPQHKAAPVAVETGPSSWMDRAILDFIARGTSPLIADARRRGQNLSWIIDRTEARNGADLIVVQLGHTESEPDGSSRRFATAGWLYLDTAREIIYEYDLPNDSLVRWN